jgi:molecular chaperone HtpG
LFEYGQDEIERDSIASLFSDLLAEKIDFKELYTRANTFVNTQIQEITQSNIGNLETEIPGLAENIIQPPMEEDLGQVLDSFTDQKVLDKALPSISGQILTPLPPILRKEVDTNKKLLELEKQSPSLNNFQMFLGISDRAFREEYDFFIVPHTTRIIWGGHRIFYIFTHASGSFSLYYDIEMFEDSGDLAGGGIFPTTTIITKKRIFIPIPENLKRFFELIEGKKRKFYVRFITT